ncbi:MAG: hypothetical protein CFH00_00746, partial [Alphaproteobacteria bacterium MarineAlpha1_Bin1]
MAEDIKNETPISEFRRSIGC